MGVFKESIMYGLYDSINNGSIYYDGLISSPKFQKYHNNQENMINSDDIYYIMNIDFSSEFYHFPISKNVCEALSLRNRPEIVLFRENFFDWCDAIRFGNVDMAVEIKKEIK